MHSRIPAAAEASVGAGFGAGGAPAPALAAWAKSMNATGSPAGIGRTLVPIKVAAG
jgi:hypothetical protein